MPKVNYSMTLGSATVGESEPGCLMCITSDRCHGQGRIYSCTCGHLLQTPPVDLPIAICVINGDHWRTLMALQELGMPIQVSLLAMASRMIVLSFSCPLNHSSHIVRQFFKLQCMQSIELSMPGNQGKNSGLLKIVWPFSRHYASYSTQ
jgi:hypothetical protein